MSTAHSLNCNAAGSSAENADAPRDLGWDRLQAALAVFILASVGRIHLLFPILGVLRPALLSGILAIAFFVADGSRARRLSSATHRTSWALVAIAFWIMASMPTSIHRRNSFELLTGDFIQTGMMFFVLVSSTRNRFDLERLMFVYMISAIIYSMKITSSFGGGGRFVNLYTYDPNDYATWVVSAIPIGIYFIATRAGSMRRLVAIGGLPIMMFGFSSASSRGGFLALAVTFAFLLVLGRAIPRRWKIAGFSAVALMLLATASTDFWNRIGTIGASDDYNATSETGRIQIWKRGLVYLADHPILGVGADNFSVAEGTLSPLASRQLYGIGLKWSAPHNTYLQIAVELGLPGFVFFLTMIGSALASLWRSRKTIQRSTPQAGQLPEALFASLLGFATGAFFLSLAYSSILYSLLAFAVAASKITGERPNRRARTPATSAASRPPQLIQAPELIA